MFVDISPAPQDSSGTSSGSSADALGMLDPELLRAVAAALEGQSTAKPTATPGSIATPPNPAANSTPAPSEAVPEKGAKEYDDTIVTPEDGKPVSWIQCIYQ